MCREELRLLLSKGEKALLRDNPRTDGLHHSLAEDEARDFTVFALPGVRVY